MWYNGNVYGDIMKKIKLKTYMNLALVAAIYVALTLILAPLSYGAIQFRLSEMLMILILYNPIYSISLIVGCLIANLASPMGALDVIFGTLATVIAIIPMLFVKNKPIASLFPSIVNAIVIGLELRYVYELPFFLSAAEVFIGEFVVVSIIGLAAFKSLEKNEIIVNHLEMKNIKESKIDLIIKPKVLVMFVFMVIGVILYFKLALYTIDDISYSLFDYTFGLNDVSKNLFLIAILIIPVLFFIISFIKKYLIGFIIDVIIALAGITFTIISIVIIKHNLDFYYYFYFLYYVAIGFISLDIYKFNKNKEESNIEDKDINI